MSAIVMVAEIRAARPTGLALELLALARRLADAGQRSEGNVIAVAFGPEAPMAAPELVAHGADRVLVVPDQELAEFDSDRWSATLASVVSEIGPELVLLGHTPAGCDIAPRLGFGLGGAVASGCTAIDRVDDSLLFTRTCHGGHARESLRLLTLPAVATLRGGSGARAQANRARTGDIVVHAAAPRGRAIVLERRRETGEAVRLEDARVVVAGGRGVNGAPGFLALQALASVLGGTVGASRVACDLGWCPPSRQIGLTGRSVAPDLYIAAGISGAGHHMAGCIGAKTIVAINNDAAAPIFRQAQWGIVGNCVDVVEALTAALLVDPATD